MKLRQWERVLKYLDDFGSITPLEALADLGIMRLGARIYDLRKKGYSIIRETEKSLSGESKSIILQRRPCLTAFSPNWNQAHSLQKSSSHS